MQVYRDLKGLPPFRNAVVTIGTFDGVHLGHRQILHQMIEVASSRQGETVIITFDPHPREILRPEDHAPRLLNTLDEKIGLLEEEGIDHLVVVPFDRAFSLLSPQAFIEDFLVQNFHPCALIIGYDHRFGHDRKGDIHLLREAGSTYGFEVVEIPPQLTHDIAVSSTRIRQYIQDGQVGMAAELLGYSYFFSGTVVRGQKIGRRLGYPTANLQSADPRKLLPGDGIYLVKGSLKDSSGLEGLLSLGMRPTFDGTSRQTEVYLLDWNKDIYGEALEVTVLDLLRKQVRFDSAEALKEQMDRDRDLARARFGMEKK